MKSRGSSVCALISGGLDSAILLDRFLSHGRRVLPLYVRGGLRWEPAEVYWSRRLLAAMRCRNLLPLRLVDLPLQTLYGRHWSLTGRGIPDARSRDAAVYLPGRNVLLSAAAAIVCAQERIPAIGLGILKGNPFGDATPAFFRQLAACLSDALRYPLRIMTPFSGLSKSELLRQRTAAPLALTCSCLRPQGHRHCGRCNKCAERRRAFCEAGITDPTPYGSR